MTKVLKCEICDKPEADPKAIWRCLNCAGKLFEVYDKVMIKDCPVEIANDIWNAAIEAAAQCVEQANRDGPYNAIVSHREIRKLKK